MGNCCLGRNLYMPLVSCPCRRRTCSARKRFRALQEEWALLHARQIDVLIKIDVAVRQQMVILLSVKNWIEIVGEVGIEFDQLNTEYSRQSATACYCPTNFNTFVRFGGRVAHVRKEVLSLLDRSPDEVAYRKVPAKIPVEPTIGMDSMLAEAWSYMEEDGVGIIAVHGMGGVGKTKLMMDLRTKLYDHTPTRFDVICWIVISTTPNLSNIQNQIGSLLGFLSNEWKEKSQVDKARDICQILTPMKYVLFLDDVWERLDLLTLGVPRPNLINKSKIVLTTQLKDVWQYMGADKSITVTCLKEEEAWNLFQEKVGEHTINAHPEIPEIAKLVAQECGGLPLALIVIGQTMSTKTTPRAWKTALGQLKKLTAEVGGMGHNILPVLKFTYDSIVNVSMRSCFLYCSLYPENYLIRKDDIVDKWIGEGFVDTFVDLLEARNEAYDYIDTLVNASLLEELSPDHIKMHAIIRRMAIWIGSGCGEIKNKYLVLADEGLTETPEVAEFEGSERMSLMVNQIPKLIGKPNCPNLLTLFLNKGAKLNHIDNEFFQSMPKLRMLDLSDNDDLKEIPEEVCNLKTLQYLNLFKTGISKLPNNLHNLINLRWLRFPRSISYIIPEGLLSNFTELRVLYLYHAGVALPPKFVEELESLEHLTDLGITISNDIDLSSFFSSHKKNGESNDVVSITTSLDVDQMTSPNLDLVFSQKMVNLMDLRIEECRELEYVISSSKIINYSYIYSLRQLEIKGCPNLKDITGLAFAPNLERIKIISCSGMKELCGEWKWELEGATPTPFPKLSFLYLFDLSELERICRYALPFPCLEGMEIYACPKLKKLPFNSSSCNSGRGITTIKGDVEWWKGLIWEDEDTRIAFQHCFPCVSFVLQPDRSSSLERANTKHAAEEGQHDEEDSGKMITWLDKLSGKKCYMISARDLVISWGDDLRYWKWISLPESRFEEVAMLNHVWWLAIRGWISIGMLSPGTKYVAYLVFKLSTNPPAFGFSNLPVEASVGTSTRIVGMVPNPGDDDRYPKQRKDGWMEIELGQYFNEGGQNGEKLEMSLMETNNSIPKGGLIVQGIEIRPKHSRI